MPSDPAASDTPQAATGAAAAPWRHSRYAHDPVSLGLRKLWQHVENEPVPAEFLALLDAIDAARSPAPDQPDDGGAA